MWPFESMQALAQVIRYINMKIHDVSVLNTIYLLAFLLYIESLFLKRSMLPSDPSISVKTTTLNHNSPALLFLFFSQRETPKVTHSQWIGIIARKSTENVKPRRGGSINSGSIRPPAFPRPALVRSGDCFLVFARFFMEKDHIILKPTSSLVTLMTR
jgi:hypothetical protein